MSKHLGEIKLKRNFFIKILLFSPVMFGAILFLLMFFARQINDNVAYNVVKELKQFPLPENTVIVEENAIADRLCGNGDGVQYFGALLLKSELSLENLEEYYAQFSNDKCHIRVEHQCDRTIKQDELALHQDNSFITNIDADNYYILYSWGNYCSIYTYLDDRGIN